MEENIFALKKIVTIYLNPITIGLEFIVLGVVMLVFWRRKPKKEPKPWWKKVKRVAGDLGIFMVIFGVFFIYMCSIRPVSDSLLYALEKEHAPLANVDSPNFADSFEEKPQHIVVLGGGARFHKDRSPTNQLEPPTTARILEGIRLHQKFPEASLIVTGRPNETNGMMQMAELFGVPADQIFQESKSRDTKDHPRYLESMLRDEPFILVTSASHMKRSYALFKSYGYEPIAAPCDFWAWPRFVTFDFSEPDLFIPRIINLYKTDMAFHECLGLAWASLRKQMAAPAPEVEQAEQGESDPPTGHSPDSVIEL